MPTEELIHFESEGSRLFGVLHIPTPRADRPARVGVVFVNGWTGCRTGPHRMFVKLARILCDQGIASLRFDPRGRGDSEGDMRETTFLGTVVDTLRAVEELRRRARLVGVVPLGISMGSNISLCTALTNPYVYGLILLSPLANAAALGHAKYRWFVFHFHGYLRKLLQVETWGKIFRGSVDWKAIRGVLFGPGPISRGNRAGSHVPLLTAVDKSTKFARNVLVIFGGRDPIAGPSHAFFLSLFRTHDVEARFHTIKEADHGFYALDWERQVVELVVGWLETIECVVSSPACAEGNA